MCDIKWKLYLFYGVYFFVSITSNEEYCIIFSNISYTDVYTLSTTKYW
jgi:hypothetical protein